MCRRVHHPHETLLRRLVDERPLAIPIGDHQVAPAVEPLLLGRAVGDAQVGTALLAGDSQPQRLGVIDDELEDLIERGAVGQPVGAVRGHLDLPISFDAPPGGSHPAAKATRPSYLSRNARTAARRTRPSTVGRLPPARVPVAAASRDRCSSFAQLIDAWAATASRTASPKVTGSPFL